MDRVWRELGAAPRHALELGLSPTDLQTLLLGVARVRARQVTPARVLRRWRQDRFVRPSRLDPRLLARVEPRLWDMLPARFAGVELSPVAPLGTCSAVAAVDQNRVLSTVRGTEVLSDPSNALAVEAARRRATTRSDRADLAACHRVLRAQVPPRPDMSAHFRLFTLVSSARDAGSARTEAAMLVDHLHFWSAVLHAFVPDRGPRLTLTTFDAPVLAERIADSVRPALGTAPSGVELADDPDRAHGGGYYTGLALGLRARDGAREIDLGDGGLTTWTAALLGDLKERCLVSCLALERLATLATDDA